MGGGQDGEPVSRSQRMTRAVWLNPGGSGTSRTYWTRVQRGDARLAQVSTGTKDRHTAVAMARMVAELESRAEFAVLDAVADHRRTLLSLFAAYRGDARLDAFKRGLDDQDLEPLVSEWNGGGNARYLAQLRRLIHAGETFPRSKFRRSEISKFLAELTNAQARTTDDEGEELPPRPASPATRNRYRVAISMFARWLVERELLESNIVRDVAPAKVARRRLVYLEPKQVTQLIDALPEPFRSFEALLAGTGMEYSAAAAVRRRDIDEKTHIVFAKGSKTTYRTRYVKVTEAWAWKIVAKHMKRLAPSALLFPYLHHNVALAAHKAASVAKDLPATTLHHHRHSFAVMQLKKGMRSPVAQEPARPRAAVDADLHDLRRLHPGGEAHGRASGAARPGASQTAQGRPMSAIPGAIPTSPTTSHEVVQVYAGGGTRTRTGFPPRDFKSLASTDFATPAGVKAYATPEVVAMARDSPATRSAAHLRWRRSWRHRRPGYAHLGCDGYADC